MAHTKIGGAAAKSNPWSQVYELIARLVGVRSNEKYPIGGDWKPLDGTSIAVFSKGDVLPVVNNEIVVWQLLA